MLYVKGKVNFIKRVDLEGKKPFHNVQLSSQRKDGSVTLTSVKYYGSTNLSVGDEVELSVIVNAWATKQTDNYGRTKCATNLVAFDQD